MDNAVALNSSLPMAVPASFAGRIAAMPARAKLSAGIGLAALIGIGVALTMNAGQSDYKVLYANLSDKDGGAVIAQLSTMNVPYKVQPGSNAIMVPAAQVPDLRLKLATAGLPKGSVSGFELMDSARFGQTQFQERLTFQRGLEGELTRSIGSLAAVQSARVHLALPNQNGFFREQQKPARLGAADAASRPHPRPRPARRHRPPGVVERARARPEGGERARPDRHAAHRQRRRRATAPASTPASCST